MKLSSGLLYKIFIGILIIGVISVLIFLYLSPIPMNNPYKIQSNSINLNKISTVPDSQIPNNFSCVMNLNSGNLDNVGLKTSDWITFQPTGKFTTYIVNTFIKFPYDSSFSSSSVSLICSVITSSGNLTQTFIYTRNGSNLSCSNNLSLNNVKCDNLLDSGSGEVSFTNSITVDTNSTIKFTLITIDPTNSDLANKTMVKTIINSN